LSIIHVSTQVTGGAGAFTSSIHVAMRKLGLSSIILTREGNSLDASVVIKPQTRIRQSLRGRWSNLLASLGFNDNKYAVFGIESSPVGVTDIQQALGNEMPTAFIFYWVSWFVSFETIHMLRKAYPKAPFVFVCLDESFLAGGCHYSWGCANYENQCINCPATALPYKKNQIKQELANRVILSAKINPVVVYPTTTMQLHGGKSAVLKERRSVIIPLGAVSIREQNKALTDAQKICSRERLVNQKLSLLVRSSSEYRKGCDLFVDAIKILNKKIPNLREKLNVISIGDQTLNCSQIDDYVDHKDLGFVQRKQLLSIYGMVDALIVTSREDAGPLMINECVALGRFVITTDIGVAKDIVKDNENGFLIQEFTSDSVAHSLLRFLERGERYGNQLVDRKNQTQDISKLTFEGYIQSLMTVIKSNQNVD